MSPKTQKLLVKLSKQQRALLLFNFKKRYPLLPKKPFQDEDGNYVNPATPDQMDEATYQLVEELENIIAHPKRVHHYISPSTCELLMSLSMGRALRRGLDNSPVTLKVYLLLKKHWDTTNKGINLKISLN